jgi:cytoskeletal protein CcmA (bactofilin family)
MWPFDRRPKNDIPTFAVENSIGSGTVVRGDVIGPGGFCVDGVIEGSIEADGPIIIGETGTVMGNVRGRDVVVLGKVRGDIDSPGHLEIGPNGVVIGEVSVVSLRLHKGGVFRGMSRMTVTEQLLASLAPVAGTRIRTLPPADGGVPPPPVAETPSVPAEDVVSHERLVTTLKDEDVIPESMEEKTTGTSG